MGYSQVGKNFISKIGNKKNNDIELESEPTHKQEINLAELISQDMIQARVQQLPSVSGWH